MEGQSDAVSLVPSPSPASLRFAWYDEHEPTFQKTLHDMFKHAIHVNDTFEAFGVAMSEWKLKDEKKSFAVLSSPMPIQLYYDIRSGECTPVLHTIYIRAECSGDHRRASQPNGEEEEGEDDIKAALDICENKNTKTIVLAEYRGHAGFLTAVTINNDNSVDFQIKNYDDDAFKVTVPLQKDAKWHKIKSNVSDPGDKRHMDQLVQFMVWPTMVDICNRNLKHMEPFAWENPR